MKSARASSMYRSIACPGSIELTEGIESKSTEYTREGTAAHELLEICCRVGCDASDFIGRTIPVEGQDFDVTQEMADAVQGMLDWLAQFAEQAEMFFEVQMSHVVGKVLEITGKGDVIAIEQNGERAIVADFKYGKHVAVDADDNTQLLTYAFLTAQRHKKVKEFMLVVDQPRFGDGGHRSTWVISRDEVMAFGKKLQATARKLKKDPVEFVPGNHCTSPFKCPALSICEAAQQAGYDAAASEFDVIAVEAGDLTELSKVKFLLDNRKLITKLLEDAEDVALKLVLSGVEVEGYKAVEGLGHRKFISDDEAVEAMQTLGYESKEVFETKLLSPAKVEKLPRPDGVKLKDVKAAISSVTHRPSGGAKLVPTSDKRPAIDRVKFDTLES